MRLDLVIRNAIIHTMDPARPRAERIGMWQGRIVGLDDDIDGLPAEHVVDAAGATVLPGFIDAHTHLAWQGIGLGAVDIADGRKCPAGIGDHRRGSPAGRR